MTDRGLSKGFKAESLGLADGFLDAEGLVECSAKRRIGERHPACDRVSSGDLLSCPDLGDLATIHADHPDYREEWRK